MQHKYADILRAIAEGKEIQYTHANNKDWTDCIGDWALKDIASESGCCKFRVKPEKQIRWVNFHKSIICGQVFPTREDADLFADKNRIACVRVEFDEVEGL